MMVNCGLVLRVAVIAVLGLHFSTCVAGVGVQNERPVVVSIRAQSALQAAFSTAQLLDILAGSSDNEKTSEFSDQFGSSRTSGRASIARISNGTLASKTQFPYATYIKMKIKRKWHLCGGTLIAPRVVLTAAHCVFTANGTTRSIEIYAVIGAADVSTVTAENIIAVGGLARPKAYAPTTFTGRYGDIALLLLRKASKKPKVALTSSKNFNSSDLFVVAGWGQTGPGSATTRLRWARLPGVSYKKLQRWAALYADPEEGQKPFKIEKDHVAVGLAPDSSGLDSCVGDSGGPLLLGGPSYTGSRMRQDVQIGIVSYGMTRVCGGNPAIGFYTKVGFWRTWIDDTLSLNNWREYSTPTRQIVDVKYEVCFNGADLTRTITKAAGACGEVCRKKPKCAAWTWNAVSKYCSLKTSEGWTRTKGTCISGAMRNPSPPPPRPVVYPPPPSPPPPRSNANSSSLAPAPAPAP